MDPCINITEPSKDCLDSWLKKFMLKLELTGWHLMLLQLNFMTLFRLWHKKNKGVQLHTLSQNSESTNMWKVTCHPPSRHVVGCDDYSFKNTIVFFLLQWDVRTIIKLKLKHASKEYQKEFHWKKTERLANMFFTFISRFHKVRNDLKPL